MSAAMSRAVPARGTGGWRAAPQAVTKAASAAYRVLVRGLIGSSRCSVVEEDTSSECCLMRKTSGRPSWLHSARNTRHEDLADSHGSSVTVRCRRETEPRRWEIPVRRKPASKSRRPGEGAGEGARVRRRFESLLSAGGAIFLQRSLERVLQQIVDSAPGVVGYRYSVIGVLSTYWKSLYQFVYEGQLAAARVRF